MTDLEQRMREVLKRIVDRLDEGPAFCMGTMSNGDKVWKGSFLRHIEDARVFVADMPEPEVLPQD